MHLPRYDLNTDDYIIYSFISNGPKGQIQKIVQFLLFNQNDLYNLSLCDKNPLTGELDDKIVTDNGDREKVLATVVAAIYSFCNQFPKAWIYATGSSPSRTRLYRMGISKYYEFAEKDFNILGETKTGWERYQKDVLYDGFLIQRKTF